MTFDDSFIFKSSNISVMHVNKQHIKMQSSSLKLGKPIIKGANNKTIE